MTAAELPVRSIAATRDSVYVKVGSDPIRDGRQ